MGLLQKIRAKSDREKNIISLVSAGIVTLIVVILWLGFGSKPEIKNPEADLKLSEISPFGAFKDQFAEIKDNFKQNFNQVIENISQTQTSTSTEQEIKNNN